jgi:DNA-binding NarL/FixJ family response regulator
MARALELVAEIGREEEPLRWLEVLLAGVLDLIPALSVSWNELDLARGHVRSVIHPDPGADWYEEQRGVFAGLMGENPLVRHFDQVGDTRPLTWVDVAEPGEVQRSELYRRFYAPLGIESQLAVALPAPPGVVLGLAVNRGPEGFCERDRALLGLLRPHVVSAYRRMLGARELRALQAVVADHGWQVWLVDDRSRVVSTSDDAGPLVGARLPEPLAATLDATVRALVRSGQAVPSAPVAVQHEGTELQAWVVGSEVGPHVVVLRPTVERPWESLRALGLSQREAEVALALADGGSNLQVAERLGMAVGTLRKHLERVYDVLEVADRTSAAARVRALARD